MKRNKANELGWGILLSLALVVLGQSCYERVDGCLDIYASNYNANADIVCEDDCCTYPSLQLLVNHLMGEENLRYDSVFFDIGSSDSVRMVGITFFLSEMNLIGSEPTLRVSDLISVTDAAGSSQTYWDDFTILDLSRGRSYTMGSHEDAGTYERITFRLGLNEQLTGSDPTSVTIADHPLSIQSDTMWRESDGYALAKVSLVTQANNNDTLEYFIPNAGNSLLMGLFVSTNIDFGENAVVSLNVDYRKWLEGIDFVAIGDQEDLVVEKIVNNLPNSISISQ